MSTEMTPLENLHYAIGELAYAMARADGIVQQEERDKFHNLIAAELRCKEYNFEVSDIIFRLMDKDRNKQDFKTTYNWAMKEIRTNGHYLSPSLKETFIKLIEKIAAAYPPVTTEEKSMIDQFKADIKPIQGDPIYYEKG
jgi:uncharacterized tellurite resistance protein B-like protein